MIQGPGLTSERGLFAKPACRADAMGDETAKADGQRQRKAACRAEAVGDDSAKAGRNEKMSRLHRAVEKAEREGLLEWTRPVEQHQNVDTTPEEPPRNTAAVNLRETPSDAVPISGRQPAAFDAEIPLAVLSMDTPLHPEAPSTDAPPGSRPWDARPSHPTPEAPVWEPGTDTPDAAGFLGTTFSPMFVAATEPGSAAAEQYRLLQTRLEANDATRRNQVLLITSPQLGDGKTTTSANLALTMAREFQHKVVLVEADLRRPSLAAQFGLQVERGLVDVLMGGVPLEDALVQLPGHQLTLLPAGAEAARSTELLASSMMHRVLDTLRARFARIVIDTTPVALADTHVLARLADGVLVVVRSGVTPRPALERALASIDRERLLGIVLNEVEETTGAYSYPGLEYSGGRRE